jgi:hypothetical protein
LVDAEVSAEQLYVGDQMVGGVGAQVGSGGIRQRPASPTTSLIEEQNPIRSQAEHVRNPSIKSTSGSPVEVDGRPAVGISVAFPVDLMTVPHLNETAIVWLTIVRLIHR